MNKAKFQDELAKRMNGVHITIHSTIGGTHLIPGVTIGSMIVDYTIIFAYAYPNKTEVLITISFLRSQDPTVTIEVADRTILFLGSHDYNAVWNILPQEDKEEYAKLGIDTDLQSYMKAICEAYQAAKQ